MASSRCKTWDMDLSNQEDGECFRGNSFSVLASVVTVISPQKHMLNAVKSAGNSMKKSLLFPSHSLSLYSCLGSFSYQSDRFKNLHFSLLHLCFEKLIKCHSIVLQKQVGPSGQPTFIKNSVEQLRKTPLLNATNVSRLLVCINLIYALTITQESVKPI